MQSWSDLPEALLNQILCQLENSAKDAKCARQVCRKWASAVFETRSRLAFRYKFPVEELHRFPSVTEVTWHILDPAGLKQLSELPRLTSFNFHPDESAMALFCDELLKSMTTKLCACCPGLRSVSLRLSCTRLTNDSLKLLWPLAPCLTSLDLVNCIYLSDKGMAHLSKLSALELLNVQKCWKVTQDALTKLKAGNALLRIQDSIDWERPPYLPVYRGSEEEEID
eukprot:scaffold391730_cov47-Prasinocladus_malaysianus.AAC.1